MGANAPSGLRPGALGGPRTPRGAPGRDRTRPPDTLGGTRAPTPLGPGQGSVSKFWGDTLPGERIRERAAPRPTTPSRAHDGVGGLSRGEEDPRGASPPPAPATGIRGFTTL